MNEQTVTAALLIIGNEILSGRTQDANLAVLAGWLGELGVRLAEARIVRDEEGEIIAALDALRARYRYVFTTGGIGPTHDDITAASIARAFGVTLVLHPKARAVLARHYGEGKLNPARLRMAHVPEGARLIDNPISAAPGFQIDNVFVLAGVPAIMRAMLASIRHRIAGGAKLHSINIGVAMPESLIAEGLRAIQQRFPDVEIGSYPFFRGRRAGANLVLRATDEALLAEAGEAVRALIHELGGAPVEGQLD